MYQREGRVSVFCVLAEGFRGGATISIFLLRAIVGQAPLPLLFFCAYSFRKASTGLASAALTA